MCRSPVCFTCGFATGAVAGAYRFLFARAYRAALEAADVRPEFVGIAGLQVPAGAILDSLQVWNDCCRIHMISEISLEDVNC